MGARHLAEVLESLAGCRAVVLGGTEPPVSLYVAGPVLADRIGLAVFVGCDSWTA